MQLWVLLITALVPLAIAPGILSAFDITPKIAILLFCESALLLFCKQLVNGLHRLFESRCGRWYVGCLAVQWLSCVASTLWSSNRQLSEAGSSWRRDGLIVESAILLFALIVAAWFMEDQRRIRIVLRTTVVTGVAASLYGIAQYFGWDPLLPSKAYQAGEGLFTIVRPPATFGHADYFANWLVMIAFFALALRAIDEDARWRAAADLTVVLAAFAIILSGTRSAMLGFLVGALVFAAIARRRVGRKAMLLLAASIACLGFLYISPPGAKLRARVHWSLDDVRGGARLLLWRDALRMAMQRPWLGFGPETFTAQFPRFESVELSRAYPDFYQESPHNMFLDALVSRGFPGAIALLALCLLAVWAARRNAALAAALAGAIVCQQFMVLTVPTAVYFYLLISMIVAGERSARPVPSRPQTIPWAAVPMFAAIALVFLLFSARLLLADRDMAVAEKRTEAGDVPGAAEAYREVRRWEPSRGDSDLRYSRAMTRLATTTRAFPTSVAAAQQATESAIRATETAEDRQNAWYNLATIAALRNDRVGVENGLRRTIDCAPNWFKPHWTLAQFLELTGRHTEARHEAAMALELDGGHDPEVTVTSQRIMSAP
jgi:putative inorganic carbon (HCO3(-)) transporter